jgi:hypothetical protein
MDKPFRLFWTPSADRTYRDLKSAAIKAQQSRVKTKRTKTSKQEGLFKQVVKCLSLLKSNPCHPGLRTHEFTSIEHPYEKSAKVFEAYVQHKTPAAYRIFWCYGPAKGEITIIAITPHP